MSQSDEIKHELVILTKASYMDLISKIPIMARVIAPLPKHLKRNPGEMAQPFYLNTPECLWCLWIVHE